MTDSLRKRAIARLEAIGLEPFAHEILRAGCDERADPVDHGIHLEWILTANASEIRAWWNDGWYDHRD